MDSRGMIDAEEFPEENQKGHEAAMKALCAIFGENCSFVLIVAAPESVNKEEGSWVESIKFYSNVCKKHSVELMADVVHGMATIKQARETKPSRTN